jgi:predicted transposase/invertase (TIGR01784 family)
MRLSDAFEHHVEHPEIELVCRVYNINFGYNKELLDKCPVLKEYMIFVDYVRENHKENDYENLQDAIERAIDRCIEENVLREFFMEHRSEVVKVMQLDYTFDRQIMLEREEARTEGRKEGWDKGLDKGREEGKNKSIEQMLSKGRTPEEIADFCGYDIEEVRKVAEKMSSPAQI